MTVSTEQPWVSNEPSQVPHDDTTKENAGMSEAQPMLSGDQAEQERKRQKDANNPICKLFSRVNMCTIFRWIAAIIVLGVSANQVATGTISKTKPPASLIVAVVRYNILYDCFYSTNIFSSRVFRSLCSGILSRVHGRRHRQLLHVGTLLSWLLLQPFGLALLLAVW